jgi:hypothetical protein
MAMAAMAVPDTPKAKASATQVFAAKVVADVAEDV